MAKRKKVFGDKVTLGIASDLLVNGTIKPATIKVGDVVQLKSGGHAMTVTDLEERDGYPSATLMWSHDGTIAIMDFPIVALTPFDAEKGFPF